MKTVKFKIIVPVQGYNTCNDCLKRVFAYYVSLWAPFILVQFEQNHYTSWLTLFVIIDCQLLSVTYVCMPNACIAIHKGQSICVENQDCPLSTSSFNTSQSIDADKKPVVISDMTCCIQGFLFCICDPLLNLIS